MKPHWRDEERRRHNRRRLAQFASTDPEECYAAARRTYGQDLPHRTAYYPDPGTIDMRRARARAQAIRERHAAFLQRKGQR